MPLSRSGSRRAICPRSLAVRIGGANKGGASATVKLRTNWTESHEVALSYIGLAATALIGRTSRQFRPSRPATTVLHPGLSYWAAPVFPPLASAPVSRRRPCGSGGASSASGVGGGHFPAWTVHDARQIKKASMSHDILASRHFVNDENYSASGSGDARRQQVSRGQRDAAAIGFFHRRIVGHLALYVLVAALPRDHD